MGHGEDATFVLMISQDVCLAGVAGYVRIRNCEEVLKKWTTRGPQ